MIIDDMWELFNDIEIPKGGLCIPLTGGLDSRLLAGIVSKQREIEYSFFFYSDLTEYNLPHVEKIAKLCRVKNFEPIKISVPVHTPGSKYEIMNKIKKTDYTVGLYHYGGTMTGIFKTRKAEREYYYREKERYNDVMIHRLSDCFKEIWKPYWTPRLVGFMSSLNRRQRLFQNLYIKMLNKYLPELANIPRCFEKGTGKPTLINKGIYYYAFRRIIDKTKKGANYETINSN